MEDLEKEFLPYPLALRMKALGYDEPCFGLFTDSQRLYIDKIINGKIFNSNNGCLAPTFSAAFRWFREKYNLYHSIDPLGFNMCLGKVGQLGNLASCNVPNYGTYEEAELACLEKLLEIVELKKK